MTSVGARTHPSTRGDSNAQGRYAAHPPLATDSRHPWRRSIRSAWETPASPLIARLAGVSNGIISHYFQDKNGLLEATMRHLLSALSKAVREMPRGALRRQSEGAPASDRRRQLRRQPGQWSGDEDLAGVLGDQHAPAGTASIAAGQRPSPCIRTCATSSAASSRRTTPAPRHAAWRPWIDGLWLRGALTGDAFDTDEAPEHRLRLPRPAVGKTVGVGTKTPRRRLAPAIPIREDCNMARFEEQKLLHWRSLRGRPAVAPPSRPSTRPTAKCSPRSSGLPGKTSSGPCRAPSRGRRWAAMTAMQRSRILRRAVDILRERNDELAALETLDTEAAGGNPLGGHRHRRRRARVLRRPGPGHRRRADSCAKPVSSTPARATGRGRRYGAWNYRAVLTFRKSAPAPLPRQRDDLQAQ